VRQIPKNIKGRVKNFFDTYLKSLAISGDENIKTELAKRGQEAEVEHSIGKNEIVFTVKPKIEKLETKKVPKKEAAKFKKVLGPVPLEMLNQEMSDQEISEVAVDEAMQITQDDSFNKFNELIEKMY
jgi:hypothetical protein